MMTRRLGHIISTSLQENGAEFRAREATGDIRCEVCEVPVNSSHQLQAHMTGDTLTHPATTFHFKVSCNSGTTAHIKPAIKEAFCHLKPF